MSGEVSPYSYSTSDNKNSTNLLLKIHLRKNAEKTCKGFNKNINYHFSVFKIDKKINTS